MAMNEIDSPRGQVCPMKWFSDLLTLVASYLPRIQQYLIVAAGDFPTNSVCSVKEDWQQKWALWRVGSEQDLYEQWFLEKNSKIILPIRQLNVNFGLDFIFVFLFYKFQPGILFVACYTYHKYRRSFMLAKKIQPKFAN